MAEYDFSKFFDRISHAHIFSCINDLELMRTPLEDELLRSFLACPEPYESLADKAGTPVTRTVGVPQGTSISLLLANLAASPLDRALERLGVNFVRYADDTLIWSRDYSAICDAVQALHEAADAIGSPINLEKSNGVRLLVPPGTHHVELAHTTEIDYLGHTAGLRSLRMKAQAVTRVKDHVQSLLFANLVREPLAGTQNLERLEYGQDRDYIVYIWQLRRYLYGPLSEQQVRRFQRGQLPPMSFQGLMSFFPLVDDDDVLLELDQWIAAKTWLALRRRSKLLASKVIVNPTVWTLARNELIGYQTYSTSARASKIDLRVPSVRRIASVVRRGVTTHGTGVVGGGAGLYMYES